MKEWLLSLLLVICLWRDVYSAKNSTFLSTTPVPSSQSTFAPSTTHANGTSTTVAPTTIPQFTCTQGNASCGECVKDIKCFWCSADHSCKQYPASKIIPRDCEGNDWYWKQCFAAGSILIYVIPSVCFVVLVIIGCGVYCLCCRKRKQKSYEREDRKMQRRREEIKQRHAERRAERKIRTDAIRQKYGLLANEDDAEVAWTDLKYWFQHFLLFILLCMLSV